MEGGEGRRKEGKGGKGGEDLNASPFETPGGAGRGAPGLLSLLKRKTSRAFFVVVSRGSRRAWRYAFLLLERVALRAGEGEMLWACGPSDLP